MADINALPSRFENGGKILIGSDTVLHVIEGSLQFTPRKPRVIQFKDRGTPQRPREGDIEPGSLRMRVRHTAEHGAAEIMALGVATGNNGTDLGQTKEYTLSVRFHDYLGSTSYDQFAWAKVYFAEPPAFQAGTEFDELELSFILNDDYAYTEA